MYPQTLYRDGGQTLVVHDDAELGAALIAFWSVKPVDPEPEPVPVLVPAKRRGRPRKE